MYLSFLNTYDVLQGRAGYNVSEFMYQSNILYINSIFSEFIFSLLAFVSLISRFIENSHVPDSNESEKPF